MVRSIHEPPLALHQPSFTVSELCSVVLLERAGPKDGVDIERTTGDGKLLVDMFPGMPTVEGVSLRGGRSVGGRGAGPGFMNWAGP